MGKEILKIDLDFFYYHLIGLMIQRKGMIFGILRDEFSIV